MKQSNEYDFLATTEFPWRHWENQTPDNIAVYLGATGITWLELNSLLNQYADLLSANNVQAKDVIVIEGKSSLNLVLLHLAAWQIGALVLTINSDLSAPQKQAIFEKVQPQWLCKLDYTTDITANYIIIKLKHGASFLLQKLFKKITNNCVANSTTNSTNLVTNLATITLTSGSSGMPKAIAHDFSAHLYSAKGILQFIPFNQDDIWLLSLPVYHVSGLAIIWRWLLCGAALRIIDTNILEDLNHVTHASLVPTQLQRYLNFNNNNELNKIKLKHLLLGGAVIPVELTNKAKQLDINIWCGYGMTETASTVTLKMADDNNDVGHCLPYRNIKIVAGQIYVSGQTLSRGFYEQQQLVKLPTDANGYPTKDSGFMTGNALTIRGRIDSAFISGGEKVFPEEVERILMTNPAIQTAVVIAIADAHFGQIGVALIKSSDSQHNEYNTDNTNKLLECVNCQELKIWMQTNAAPHQRPKAYYYLPNINQSGSIKISRNQLTNWFLEEIHSEKLI